MTRTEAIAQHFGISLAEAEEVDIYDIGDEDMDAIDEIMLADEMRQHNMAMVYDAGWED